jgi:hypothetical protein
MVLENGYVTEPLLVLDGVVVFHEGYLVGSTAFNNAIGRWTVRSEVRSECPSFGTMNDAVSWLVATDRKVAEMMIARFAA